jgi:hypothetical protein
MDQGLATESRERGAVREAVREAVMEGLLVFIGQILALSVQEC